MRIARAAALTPTLLTPLEAGEILRCSAGTIKRYVRQGELQAFRHRGRVLIPAEAVACFIESNLTGPSEVERPKASRARRKRPAAREPLEPGRRLVDFHSSS